MKTGPMGRVADVVGVVNELSGTSWIVVGKTVRGGR